MYFIFHNGKKSSLDRPSYTSIQVFQFKISVKKKGKKEIRFNKQKFFFVTSIQFVACVLRENLSNLSSGVQIPRDICTRLGHYLYSTKCSWIIIIIISGMPNFDQYPVFPSGEGSATCRLSTS